MVRRLLTRLRSDQRGFTLVEQIVVAGLMIVIVGAIAGLMEVAQRVTPEDTARAHQVREAQVGLDRMMRELRHATPALTVTDETASGQVQMRGSTYTVTYDCSGAMAGAPGLRQCVRTADDGGPASVTVIERIVNAPGRPVFSKPSDDYVATTIEVQLPAAGGRVAGKAKNVVLEDGAYLRNADEAP